MIVTEKKLDEKDKQILMLAAEGMTAKEIGYELNTTQYAVQAKIRIMKSYYNCRSLTELVAKFKDGFSEMSKQCTVSDCSGK